MFNITCHFSPVRNFSYQSTCRALGKMSADFLTSWRNKCFCASAWFWLKVFTSPYRLSWQAWLTEASIFVCCTIPRRPWSVFFHTQKYATVVPACFTVLVKAINVRRHTWVAFFFLVLTALVKLGLILPWGWRVRDQMCLLSQSTEGLS